MSGVCTLFFAIVANAQDINQAIELNNKGAEAVQAKEWVGAITQFNLALAVAQELEEEEAADMVQQIKDFIPALHLFLGQELAKEAQIEEAIEQLNKAIELAQLYDDFGTTAIDAKKLIDQLKMKTANDLFNDKKYEEAIVAFQNVLETDPNNGSIYLYIGVSHAALNNDPKAIEAYQKAIDLGNKDAATRLANLYVTQANAANKDKKWAVMNDLAKKALAITPDNANALKFIGISAFEQKKYDEAIPALEKTIAANPNAPDKNGIIYRLAQAFEAQNKNSQACAQYKLLLNDATFKQMAEHKIKNVLKCQ
ncbi:MAG: tetratricopeptide repeat protein [Prevotellaceae bacterium]|nr:tetratricopeptide repeat protein [Prevotellaceae bacterium]